MPEPLTPEQRAEIRVEYTRASFGRALYVANDPGGESRCARDVCNATYEALVAAIEALDGCKPDIFEATYEPAE